MTHRITKLPILIINVHSRCNCRCGMCDIWRTTTTQEFSLAQLREQMPEIERLGVQWVVFSGGEPLMHSNLFELTAILRDRGIKVTILSTGLLLERFAVQIARSVDEVIVSVDGPEAVHDAIRRTPGCFHAIRQGVEALRAARPDFHIMARSTLQRTNHDCIFETISAAKDAGLNSLSFLAADVNSNAFGRDLVWPDDRQQQVLLTVKEIEILQHQIERLIALEDPFVTDSPQHLRRIISHFRAHRGIGEFKAPRCNAPWVSAVLEPNGDLRPCFFHPVVGSNAVGALNGEPALEFRSTLDVANNATCQRCVCSLYRSPA